ncbi:hypothetical protein [Tessaracoccus sp. OH4464_COT-324]|uniref:hypothetical protein n=1 Tax=Tessaracoccus sp. OH4464_COT-324 TaxID=2491059 RepID=UPI000F644A5F|nr:hypothetical protein [Tessaracoccus sp. OH4464_COT-324]RRD46093.1 hypothetical protein EII42_08485 [Tessaracoccus sp. OH4464_COT-324]
MKIDPGLQARVVEALVPRVRRRVDALLSEPPPLGPTVDFGKATVRLADVEVASADEHLTCDCLLAPACAHRAVVALLLPLAAAEAIAAGPPPGDVHAPPPQPAARARTPSALDRLRRSTAARDPLPITEAQLTTVHTTWRHLADVLLGGSHRLDAARRAQLAGDLHQLRTRALHVADRALTGFVGALGTDDPQSPGFAAAVVNLYQLSRLSPGDEARELIGRIREAYTEIGGLSLAPLYAEPVLTGSGFSGVAAHFVDADGTTWRVEQVLPGGRRNITRRYAASEPWGGLSAPLRALSRHHVLLSSATARADRKLGGGRQVRAVLQNPWSGWERLPEGHRLVAGPIVGGDREGIVVAGERLTLLPTAARLGAGLGTELFGAAVGTQVTCLVAGDTLLGMRVGEGVIELPDELGGLWWPGLDTVERSWVGQLPAVRKPPPPTPDDVTSWADSPPKVRLVVERWCERVLRGGSSVVAAEQLERDAQWLRSAGAPFAGELLLGLRVAMTQGGRRFDGTWCPDAEAFLLAWLRLSQY